jgi:hypothetical protein
MSAAVGVAKKALSKVVEVVEQGLDAAIESGLDPRELADALADNVYMVVQPLAGPMAPMFMTSLDDERLRDVLALAIAVGMDARGKARAAAARQKV